MIDWERISDNVYMNDYGGIIRYNDISGRWEGTIYLKFPGYYAREKRISRETREEAIFEIEEIIYKYIYDCANEEMKY